MGKGRAPCCDKSQVKRGPWSPAEDLRLINFIQRHGHENWRALPKQAGLLRCGKSCRLRWINYLRPDVKRGNFTKEEEDTIIQLHQALGNKWSKIASHLPGRTDNEIKNVWNTHLKKRLQVSNEDSADVNGEDESKESSVATSPTSSSSSTIISSGESNHNNQGSPTKKPRVSVFDQDTEAVEPKEHEFSISSSISSNNSNVTNSNADQVDVSKLEAEMGSLLDFGGNFGVNKTLEEVNKPEQIQDFTAEMAFEPDNDFWYMIDSFSSSFQSDNQVPLEGSNLGDAYNELEDANNTNWLRYLENELGLENLCNETSGVTPITADSGCKMEMGYHQLWPSL